VRDFDQRLGTLDFPYSSGVWRYKELVYPDLDDGLIVSRNEGNTNLYHVPKLAAWAGIALLPLELDWRVGLAWLVALVSHPALDVLTTGPELGARGYGIGVLWPVGRSRWYMERPLVNQTTEWESCRSLGEVWHGLKPELAVFGSISLVVFVLALVL